MKKMFNSSLRDIKKMFASEHVFTFGSIYGTKYIDIKTKKELPKHIALKILAGDY